MTYPDDQVPTEKMSVGKMVQLGRAKNAVLTLLERKLVVPKIFLDAEWAGSRVPVLAIDRAGVGDVHVVLLFSRPRSSSGRLDLRENARSIEALIDQLKAIPAQYRYIAAVDVSPSGKLPKDFLERSFAQDGLGRIGFIGIHAPMDGEPVATLDLKPERFRASVFQLADDYVQQHTADWEIALERGVRIEES